MGGGGEFLIFNILLHTKAVSKLISKRFCTPIRLRTFKNLIKQTNKEYVVLYLFRACLNVTNAFLILKTGFQRISLLVYKRCFITIVIYQLNYFDLFNI